MYSLKTFFAGDESTTYNEDMANVLEQAAKFVREEQASLRAINITVDDEGNRTCLEVCYAKPFEKSKQPF